MVRTERKKIVYLFGAGATHAELTNLDSTLIEERDGLLISSVSARVIEKARRSQEYLRGIEMVSSTKGSLNIELLISLIENSKIDQWDKKTSLLKKLVRGDIERVLTASRTSRFYLHKALLEFHELRITRMAEQLLGLISLNYDRVLDKAFETFHGEPNYCFSLEKDAPASTKIPLLKLHGSFNWHQKTIRGRKRTIEIIPLGSSKNYLHSPYGFIWNRALEILIECDTLRVIGCSLSQNDAHLIDLLFKAHLEKGQAFEIEIIGPEVVGDAIKGNYGFFPGIKKLTEIESALIPDPRPANPFRAWLNYKCRSLLRSPASLGRTRYIRRVVS